MAGEYQKNKEHVYQVEHPHKDVVILPAKYVDEIKAMPDNVVNFLEDINDRFLGEYTKMLAPGGIHDETLTYTIKNDLTKNIGNIMGELQEEIAYAFSENIGECKNWTEIYPHRAIMRMVALVSGRIFAGPALNRNEEYLHSIVHFSIEGFPIIDAMRKYPKFLRPLAQLWVKECQKPIQHIKTMERLLKPVIEERQRTGEEPQDMLTWIMNNSPAEKSRNLAWQAQYQLQIATAAMHTTSITMTQIWLDLAGHPEYAPILREEILQVLSEEPSGTLTRTSVPKLKKLDSFIKESQRINPFSSTGFSRKLKTTVTFHDGLTLPSSTTVTFPVSCISMDPTIYPSPEEFDGLRFWRLRENKGEESKWQYTTTGKECLNWGHGVHACPGRFFAANEIKIIMIYLLMNYEVKMPDGAGRPKNLWTEGGMVPDASKAILVRAR
ncbi:putative cytochrome P450 [Bisporella sp. PMI_857]|nr:putative cytochrome P450 [Bisporella sp. PMI_857]